jgi:hypothetical protein
MLTQSGVNRQKNGKLEQVTSGARVGGGGGAPHRSRSKRMADPPKPTRQHKLTSEQWFKLPLDLRQRWLRETDFDLKPPSDELLADVHAALRDDQNDKA